MIGQNFKPVRPSASLANRTTGRSHHQPDRRPRTTGLAAHCAFFRFRSRGHYRSSALPIAGANQVSDRVAGLSCSAIRRVLLVVRRLSQQHQLEKHVSTPPSQYDARAADVRLVAPLVVANPMSRVRCITEVVKLAAPCRTFSIIARKSDPSKAMWYDIAPRSFAKMAQERSSKRFETPMELDPGFGTGPATCDGDNP